MSRNHFEATELIPMPRPSEAAQLSLPIILHSALYTQRRSLHAGAPGASDVHPGGQGRLGHPHQGGVARGAQLLGMQDFHVSPCEE